MTATLATTPDAPIVQSSAPDRRFPVRKVDFTPSFDGLRHGYMAEGDVIFSHVIATLSGVFPDGEEMFIESVKHFRDRVTDPDLLKQVNAFIGQEVTHGREHRALNTRLAELGYRSKLVEESFHDPAKLGRGVALVIRGIERLGIAGPSPADLEATDPVRQEQGWLHLLALTAALEHFTATLAEFLLTDEHLQATFPPDLFRMFAWHAIEECEHKAVAFDVYRAVDGSEALRRRALREAAVGLGLTLFLHAGIGTLKDRDTYRFGSMRRSLRTLRRTPVAKRAFWARLRDYNRRDFHPLQHDTVALEESWRAWFEDGAARPTS